MYFSKGILNLVDFMLNKYTLVLMPIFAIYGVISFSIDLIYLLDIKIVIG